jgi:hypothetical protein
MACKRKCKTLSLSDKKKLIKEVEKGIKKKKDITADLGSLQIRYRQLLKTNIWC